MARDRDTYNYLRREMRRDNSVNPYGEGSTVGEFRKAYNGGEKQLSKDVSVYKNGRGSGSMPGRNSGYED